MWKAFLKAVYKCKKLVKQLDLSVFILLSPFPAPKGSSLMAVGCFPFPLELWGSKSGVVKSAQSPRPGPESPVRTQRWEEGKQAAASLLASLPRHPPQPLPFIYLLVPVEPVGGGCGEGAQVSQQPLPPQVELNGLQEPQGQAEHKSQVKGPRPARLQPGLHPSAPRGLLAGSRRQGEGDLSRASRLDRITQPTGLCALGEALCIPGKEKQRWEEQLALGQKRQARVPGSLTVAHWYKP